MNLSLKRKIQWLSPLLMLGLMGPHSSSYAANKVYCSMYTQTAVAQNEQNIENDCGYDVMPRWSSDPAHHTEWCLNATDKAAKNENTARVGQLAKCPGIQFPAGADKGCHIYSIVAIGQNKANLSAECSLSGPTWSASYTHHYRWCITASKDHINAQMTARQHALDKCAQ